jgi:peptidoglycan/xylan/chitin deacetylase (PgdA/CDA1 family)
VSVPPPLGPRARLRAAKGRALARLERLTGHAPTVVLMYHRVGPEERDLQHLRVRDDRFAAQLDVMQRYADIVPLTEVRRPAPRPRVAITFDDGYADNLNVAEPILAEHAAPATVFVATAIIEAGRGFWQDQLAALVLDGEYGTEHLAVSIAGEPLRVDLRTPEAREAGYRALHQRARRCPPDEIDAVLADVAGQLGADLDALGAPPTLKPDEVRTLAASDVVDVGSHTLRHPFLSALTPAQQRPEIVDSRARLAAMSGTPVTTFAYPFGVAEAFDATSVELAAEAGYDLSVTGVPGRVTRFTSAHRIPRRFVGDWDAATFERRFRAWIGA